MFQKFTYSIILSALTTGLFAQKIMNEGVITYQIAIESTKGEKQVASALNGATVTLFVTKDRSRTEMVSTPGTETTVFDNKAGTGYILKEYSGQKLMITTTKANWEQKNQSNTTLKFTIDDNTTNILGYNCKKAVATADGKQYTVYFDPSIIIANKNYNNAFPQLPGLPVQYELSSGNLNFKYSLLKYSFEGILASKFDAPKVGFRTMTYEENQQLKRGE